VEAETAIIYNLFWVPMGIYLSARVPLVLSHPNAISQKKPTSP